MTRAKDTPRVKTASSLDSATSLAGTLYDYAFIDTRTVYDNSNMFQKAWNVCFQLPSPLESL